MPVYRELRDVDFLHTVLTAGARVSAASGTSGWRGGLDGTGSASVYGGVRGPRPSAVTVVPRIGPSAYDLGQFQPFSGSYPSTASLKYVEVGLHDIEETPHYWGNRSWEPVERLYDWYSRSWPAYTTASYDFNCLFFRRGSANVAVFEDAELGQWQDVTSSLTVEAWVKPFSTSSVGPGMTIIERTALYRLYVTGSGLLAFSSSLGIVTSSEPLDQARWSHVAVSAGSGQLSMYVDLRTVGSLSYTPGPLAISTASFSPTLSVGNTFLGPRALSGATVYESAADAPPFGASGSGDASFYGFIHEPREWTVARTAAQVSSSHASRIDGSSTGLAFYSQMREGALSGTTEALMGSSSLNSATENVGADMRLYFFTSRPSWQPCDNPRFFADRTEARTMIRPSYLKVLNVPRLMYGRQIATGTLELSCRSFSDEDHGMLRVLRDDGRGGLYVRSYVSASSDDEGDENVPWNRVGTVFYAEGLAVVSHPSLQDFANDQAFTDDPANLLSVSFKGTSRVPTSVVSCRLGASEANASNNRTYVRTDSGKPRIVDEDRTTYVTAVGLYDKDRNLVAVAKLAHPLRKRESDRINVRLKIDL